jgi:hypothetical protein
MATLHSHGSEPSAPRRGVRGYLALITAAGMALGMIVAALSFLIGSQLTGAAAIVAAIGLFFYTSSSAIGLQCDFAVERGAPVGALAEGQCGL